MLKPLIWNLVLVPLKSPAHDQNDYNTGKRNNLEFINIYTDDGLLNENCGPEWKGMKKI